MNRRKFISWAILSAALAPLLAVTRLLTGSLECSGAAASTVRGLNHLEGEMVTIYNEAKAQRKYIVTQNDQDEVYGWAIG